MLNNKLTSLHPDLRRVFARGLAAYAAAHPHGPTLSLNETSRSEPVQTAYFARGRKALAVVLALYKTAGLGKLTIAEAGTKISNAAYGNSAHNYEPSRAFDMKLEDAHGNYLGADAGYKTVWPFMQAAAIAERVEITCGGTWKDWPHIELKHWRKM